MKYFQTFVRMRSLTCVRAEHSTYLTAFRSRASFSAVSGVIGFCLFFASFSMVDGSSLRSICVPTSRNGVFGQWWVISGTHWERYGCSSIKDETDERIKKNRWWLRDQPFLWRFRMKKGKRRRNRLRRHLFGGNWEVVIYRNLPDLSEECDSVKSRQRTNGTPILLNSGICICLWDCTWLKKLTFQLNYSMVLIQWGTVLTLNRLDTQEVDQTYV